MRALAPPALLPDGCTLRIDGLVPHETGLTMQVSARRRTGVCPVCGRRSNKVHSTYERTLRDLPWCGTMLSLHIQVRRFICGTPQCPRRIFAEQFPGLVGPRARLTERLRLALHHIGLALGGQAGARLAARLSMHATGKTILGLVRAGPLPTLPMPSVSSADPPLRVLGIDDWSWRRGHRYGTLLCDLERHRVVDLLPDRSAETVAAWLVAHPRVAVVSRDRSGLYADAATRGAPHAVQVADRWHLVDNLIDALERFLLHKKHLLKETARTVCDALNSQAARAQGAQDQHATAAGAVPTDEMYPGRRKHPSRRAWLEQAEAESQRRHAVRVACYERIQALAAAHADKADIARMVGVSRQTVHRYLALSVPPERRQPKRRGEVLDPWKPYLLQRWAEGCHNALRLWREIRAQGFVYSSANVARFAASIRRGEFAHLPDLPAATIAVAVVHPLAADWSARRVASLLVYRLEELSELQQTYLCRLCQADSAIAEAAQLTARFLRLVRERGERAGEELDSWIAAATASGVAELRRYAGGLLTDKAAVQAGLTLCWSNGQVEGQIHRLKLLKRQMYGRAGFELLRRRVLSTA